MTSWLWTLVAAQIAMGAFDTLFHHEGTERLAWRPSQRRELQLHGVRNLLYTAMFATLGWAEPRGALASALIALLAAELVTTLWDFVEEDRTRRLPASERVTHTLLTLNYGAILVLLAPLLLGWAAAPTGLGSAYHGFWSWLCAAAACGTAVAGVRDLAAAARVARLGESDPASLAAGLPPESRVLVTGGTGFIGSRLVAALAAAGHDVTVLTRRRENASSLPAPLRIVTDLAQIPSSDRIDAIVNLAGEPIGNGLWTASKRRRIVESRLGTTWDLGRLIERLETRPEVLVSGSAIGWYGLRGDEPLAEDGDFRDCFSHRLCSAWEYAAQLAAGRGVRLVLLRTGLVLGREGGVLSRMLAPFEFGLGGRFGDGRQWMSWIHRDDLVRLIVRAIADPELAGPLNGTAPKPATNAEFARALGRALGRPAIFPVPAAPLRFALGDFADELLLGGQRVLPDKARAGGFRFDYPDLDGALAEIVGRPARPSAAAGEAALGAAA
ncbi:MAG TPA: TIGR01777 family oxidoreductase [Allosphingosinicella sp.]|jgi:hypothetical protein